MMLLCMAIVLAVGASIGVPLGVPLGHRSELSVFQRLTQSEIQKWLVDDLTPSCIGWFPTAEVLVCIAIETYPDAEPTWTVSVYTEADEDTLAVIDTADMREDSGGVISATIQLLLALGLTRLPGQVPADKPLVVERSRDGNTKALVSLSCEGGTLAKMPDSESTADDLWMQWIHRDLLVVSRSREGSRMPGSLAISPSRLCGWKEPRGGLADALRKLGRSHPCGDWILLRPEGRSSICRRL